MQLLQQGQFLGVSERTRRDGNLLLSKTSHLLGETPLHTHTNDYFSILLSGNYLERSKSQSLLIRPGDIVYRKSGHAHQNEFVTDSVSCVNIELSHRFAGNVARNCNFFLYSGNNKQYFYRLMVDFLLKNPFMTNNSFLSDERLLTGRELAEENGLVWLLKIIGIINEEKHLFHPTSALADRVFIHPNYLARAFKENTGQTISAYQLSVKLNHAVLQLLNSGRSISDISFDYGFYDDAHFIRSFKKQFGIAPLRFRRLVKG
jgi:AraC-like DNA-binding protein